MLPIQTRQETAPNYPNTAGSEATDVALVPAIAADTASGLDQTSADAVNKDAYPDADPQTSRVAATEPSVDPTV